MSDKSPKKILLLSSNPLASGRLRVDEELREIREALQKASKREQFIIDSIPAVRFRDINREVLTAKANIVHFSGHGMGEELKEGEDRSNRKLVLDVVQSDEGGLIVEDEMGQVKVLNTKALAGLFKLFADTVECVVLNACFSHVQAQAIAEYIPYVVGMGKTIGDRAAIEFAISFYTALGEGRGYQFAVDYACNAIDLAGIPESDTPKLFGNGNPKSPNLHSSKTIKTSNPASKNKQIIREFMNGNMILFLGSGINPYLYIDAASHLMESIIEDLNGEDTSGDFIPTLIGKLIGIPCQICHYAPEKRPPGCPMLKGVERDDSCSLYVEQSLAVASMNLRHLSQYYKLNDNLLTFYDELRDIFGGSESQQPNELHRLLAELPHNMLAKNYPKRAPGLPFQLIVTTNYDNLLERSFDIAHQPYDLIYYVADGDERGKYKHKPYGEDEAHIVDPLSKQHNGDLPLRSPWGNSSQPHPIILKLYGTWEDQFILTQDQINYLTSASPINNLPDSLITVLNQCSILFLGYSPSDSDLQLIVNRFWPDKKLTKGSCLVHQSKLGEIEEKIWQDQRGVKLISLDDSLEDFMLSLQSGIEEEINKK